MPTSFATAILRPDCHLRFYLYVEGLPFVFLDGSAPVGPTGAAWSAPTSKTYAYTLRENMLDVSGGIRDNGPDISRRTAQTRASRMTITLQEDRAGNLLSLMARRKSTGKTAQLAADFGFATGGGPTTMTVDDNSAWASSGYLYFGRETIRYGAKPSATSFGTLTRDVFQLDDGGSTYGDGRYVHNENVATPGGFSVVSDYPRVWHGRWVSLRAFVVDADGRAYDTAFDGTASREIWRGTVNGNPQPKADWERWDLRCRSIEGLLNATDIGSQTVGGSLLRYPGGHKANTEGFTDVDASGEPIINSTSSAYVYFLDDSTRFLDVKIDEYTSQANYDAGTKSATYDLTGESRIEVSATSGVFTRLGLGNTLDLNVNAALTTAGVTNLYMEVHYTGEAQFPTLRPRSTTYVHVLHFDFGVVGSVGKLLGLEGALTHVSKGVGASVPGPAEQLAAYIHPKALTIPVWFAETEGYSPATGGLPDAVPAAGFARIGEEEIVHYSSITDLSDDYVQGLFQLNVSKRGALGTKPQEHRVPSVLMTFATDVDVVKVEFGAGFSDTDPLTALLQLCVSTGESGHHTSYDALGFGVGPQMNPSHFDRDQWASMAAQLSPTFQALSYFISKSVKLSDLVESWLSPLGMFLYAGSTDDDDFRIRVGQVVPALESATEDDIDSSVIARNESAVWLDSITKISNQLVVHYGWDTLTEEESDDTITVNAWDSQREYGVKGRHTWKLRGYNLDAVSALPLVAEWGYRMFARFAHPYDLFKVFVGRIGWELKPGDAVNLTLPGAPTTDGSRGFTDRAAVVLTVARTYHSGMTGRRDVGAEVTVILEDDTGRYSTYSPSARITSKSGADVDVAANDFTEAGNDTDAAHFEVGDEVTCFQAGDVSTRETRTIQSISGNTITLDSALTLTPGANTYMTAADYTAVQSTQTKHAFIADNSDPPVLTAGGSTTPFEYV